MSRLAARLLKWYGENRRALPWRGHPDPYAVWVSEIMLQQTRVETVIPYFLRWMERFPSITVLAHASERQVLRAWEGLGYYARARNLRQAARIVVKEFGGELPDQAAALRQLPGIGPYTAGAIASIAFGRDEPALDGNIRRVLARVFDVEQPADSPEGLRRLWDLAARNLPGGRAGDYNQALMDLGAAVCLPAGPRCPVCPLNRLCQARRLGIQEERPRLRARRGLPQHVRAAAVIVRNGKVLLAHRPAEGLLGGMWEFPNARVPALSGRKVAGALRAEYHLGVQIGEELANIRHAYSHFAVEVHAFRCRMSSTSDDPRLRWVPLRRLGDFPMGRTDRLIGRKLA